MYPWPRGVKNIRRATPGLPGKVKERDACVCRHARWRDCPLQGRCRHPLMSLVTGPEVSCGGVPRNARQPSKPRPISPDFSTVEVPPHRGALPPSKPHPVRQSVIAVVLARLRGVAVPPGHLQRNVSL